MNSNKNLYKNAIYFLIASAVITVIAIASTFIFGLNNDASTKIGNLIFDCSLSVILSMLAIFIYIGIRYDFVKSFCVILTIAHNVILSTAIIALIQAPVSNSLLMAYILLVGLTAVFCLIIMEKVNKINLKKEDYNTVIKSTLKSSIKPIVIVSAVVVATILLGLVIKSASMFDLVRQFLVMIVVIIYSMLTIYLPIWCFFSSKFKNIKKPKVDNNIENQKVIKAVAIDGENDAEAQAVIEEE